MDGAHWSFFMMIIIKQYRQQTVVVLYKSPCCYIHEVQEENVFEVMGRDQTLRQIRSEIIT